MDKRQRRHYKKCHKLMKREIGTQLSLIPIVYRKVFGDVLSACFKAGYLACLEYKQEVK